MKCTYAVMEGHLEVGKIKILIFVGAGDVDVPGFIPKSYQRKIDSFEEHFSQSLALSNSMLPSGVWVDLGGVGGESKPISVQSM